MKCMYCHTELRFDPERGWIHVYVNGYGGGAYVMYCPECNWIGAPYPSAKRCPTCGSKQVRDHHSALPETT
jgi:rubrerythrin